MKILQHTEIKKHSRTVNLEADIEGIKLIVPEIVNLCKNKVGKYGGGYAIAHCQVDKDDPMRFFVIHDGTVIINPVIVEKSSDKITEQEGCMSFAFRPQKKVIRPAWVIVNCQKMVDGVLEEMSGQKIEGKLARIFQHEMDHFVNKYIY